MTLPTESSTTGDVRRLRILYRALGDDTRLRIIGLLAEFGPMPVGDLSTRVGLSQPLISWHLRRLRVAGLIDTRRNGRETICQLRRAAFDELHEDEARLLDGTADVASGAPRAGEEIADVG